MSVSESEKECPLCMEALDWDDLGFFPCSCGYQICRFCWHRLRTDENGLCPACRQAFPDMPVSFNPEISAEELKKQKRRNRERRSNKEGQVLKPQDLATLRVVQKNLVFVIGLSPRLTQEDLKKEFAHFGKIIKFVHNKSTAYITYSRPEEAIRAIRTLNASAAQEMAVQQLQLQTQLTNGITNTTTTNVNMGQSNGINNSLSGLTNASSLLNTISVTAPTNRLKASLGTTKYCNHFLRSQQCPKVGECMYLHEIAEAEASFTKEQMQAGKHVEYEKKLMDSYMAKMDWPSNIASQNNGFRVNQHNNLQPMQQQPLSQHQSLSRQISPQLSANQMSPTNQSPSNYDHRQQSNMTQTTAAANIPLQDSTTNNNNNVSSNMSNNNNSSSTSTNNTNNNIGMSSRDLSPDLLPQTSLLTQSLLQQTTHHQPPSNHSPNHLIRQSVPTSQMILDHHSGETTTQAANLLLRAQQSHQQNHQVSLARQQQHHQQQQQQLALEADSDDDGLDFDPISVSTSGLRDLLDQQVQQAKQQLQMQSYLQQMSHNQSLASVLFQQNSRLNQNATSPSRLLSESSFNGHGTTVPALASLNTASNHQEQVAWHNWSSWTNFLQRSGYGFENSK